VSALQKAKETLNEQDWFDIAILSVVIPYAIFLIILTICIVYEGTLNGNH
jgi:hypothetical protein